MPSFLPSTAERGCEATEHAPDSTAIERAPDDTATERVLERITCHLWKFDDGSAKRWWGCTFDSQIFFVLATASAVTSECGLWDKRADAEGRPCWVNDSRGYYFFEDDVPSEYVIEENGCQEEEAEGEEGKREEGMEVGKDPYAADDNAWIDPPAGDLVGERAHLNPGATEPGGESSVMLRALQLGLRNLRMRLLTDAPNIEQHIEETFDLLLELARES
jgi:hypothetical protein